MKFLLQVSVMLFVLVAAAELGIPRATVDQKSFESLKSQLQDLQVSKENDDDDDIVRIANREYESAHGRILAVNMAHMRKRMKKAKRERDEAKKNTNDTNVWEEVERVNEADHLNLYQGDILMDEETEELLGLPLRSRTKRDVQSGQMRREKRNAQRSRKRLWHTRIIPYVLPGYMESIRNNLNAAIAEIQRSTCLRIVPYVPGRDRNYVLFNQAIGCASKVGRKYHTSGLQYLSLGSGCQSVPLILHELMHTIGFFHEQSRADRDKFVEIKWENILKGYNDQFEKYSWKTLDLLGQSYDYDSIMHYDRKAFTKNGRPTIVAIGNPNKEFGSTRSKLSTKDIIKINALYNCQSRRYGWTQWSSFTPCTDRAIKYRERYCYHSGNPRRQCGPTVNIYGIETDHPNCTEAEMRARNAIHGHWSRWSAWRPCSVTCNDGIRTKFRQCNNPTPSKYGKQCVGASVQRQVCTVKRCHLAWHDTEFETNSSPFGMWSNSGKIPWRRHRGFTQTINTGPMKDYTSGNGYYLYMESSYPAKPGQTSVLRSPYIRTRKTGQCLKFYYYMYGNTMGSLRVLLKQNSKSFEVFKKTGNQGKGWKLGMASIDTIVGAYKLVIEAKVGYRRGYSDIAIDNVYIDDGLCACQDKYASCITWARKDDCKSNAAWMSTNCKRTCRTCVCRDKKKLKDCTRWASKKLKQCEKNPRDMLHNCAKSCGICPVCEDVKVQCPRWAKQGFCIKNQKWMEEHCPQSCKICVGCADDNAYKTRCPTWARKGECIKNKVWMPFHCKKSCNMCACADKNARCSGWAKAGQCEKNLVYMLVNCKRSCGRC